MATILDCLNFVAFAMGGGLLGIGVWILIAGSSMIKVLASLDTSLKSGVSVEMLAEVADRQGSLRTVAIVLTVAGCVVLVTAVTGIMTLVQKSTVLATIYSIAVFLALCGIISSMAFIIFKKPGLHEDVRTSLVTNHRKYFVARTKFFNNSTRLQQAFTKFFDHMHITYGCCGVVKYDDVTHPTSKAYQASIGRDPDYNATMPVSCCKLSNQAEALTGQALKLVDGNCPYSMNSSTLYKEPCYKFVKELMDKVLLSGYIISGFLVFLLIAALVLMVVKCRSRIEDDSDSDSDSSSD